MKQRILTAVISIAIAFTGIASFASAVSAASDDKYSYSFYNMNQSANTAAKDKYTSKKVYIHPTSGPMLKYTVQGYDGTEWENRSSTHKVQNGVQASFTNFVYENHEPKARVHLKRTTQAYTNSNGYWNPDPSKVYKVFK